MRMFKYADWMAIMEKLERLARVRENQRKSRARRQEYIRELEQKLTVCKDEARQRDIEHRLAVQRLELENRKLKHLLVCLGVQPPIVDEYLRSADHPASTQKVAIPALPRPDVAVAPVAPKSDENPFNSKSSCGGRSSCGQSTSNSCSPAVSATTIAPKQLDVPLTPEAMGYPSGSSCGSSDIAPTSAQHASTRGTPDSTQQHEDDLVCGCGEETSGPWPSTDDVLNTTLCSIAADLIRQYNTQGVDMALIRQKLRVGFRKGLGSGDGCRVQNQTLFEILDEISNEL